MNGPRLVTAALLVLAPTLGCSSLVGLGDPTFGDQDASVGQDASVDAAADAAPEADRSSVSEAGGADADASLAPMPDGAGGDGDADIDAYEEPGAIDGDAPSAVDRDADGDSAIDAADVDVADSEAEVDVVVADAGAEVEGDAPAQRDAAGDGPLLEASSVLHCNPQKPFGTPVRLALDDHFSDVWGTRLTGDQLSLFFTTMGHDYVSTRSSVDSDFTTATFLSTVNSTASEWAPSVTGDGLNLFVESTRSDAGGVHIFFASRAASNQDFSTPVELANVNSNMPNVSDIQPYVLPDGSVLYFGSTRSGNDRIYRSERSGPGAPFQSPAAVSLQSTDGHDWWPVVTPDELTIYFGSNRTAPDAVGGADIYVVRRSKREDPWGAPTNVTELNGSGDEVPDWISADGCVLYYHQHVQNVEKTFVATRGK